MGNNSHPAWVRSGKVGHAIGTSKHLGGDWHIAAFHKKSSILPSHRPLQALHVHPDGAPIVGIFHLLLEIEMLWRQSAADAFVNHFLVRLNIVVADVAVEDGVADCVLDFADRQ